jgi:signal transduction histidine kinase
VTLSRKILLRNLAVLAGVMLLGGAAVAGLWRLRGHVDVAIAEYSELRLLSAAETGALEAEAHLVAAQPDAARAVEDLGRAIDALGQYLALQDEVREGSAGHERREEQKASAAAQSLRAARGRLAPFVSSSPARPPPDAMAMAAEVRAAVGHLQDLAREADNLVARTGRRASSGVRETLAAVAATFLLIVASTVVIGILQHRGMIAPLRALTDGVRAVAAGRFAQRLRPAGDREFARLTQEFNRMAGELDDLYQSLEAKVAAKSRELVRSERLASVGFLAAGVAHEINNPLHIISGYAQLSLKRLARACDPAGAVNGRLDGGETLKDALRDARQSLQIIRDEAFRCKRITENLLSLSEPGAGAREQQAVSLARAARDVAEVVLAHEACRDRELVWHVNEAEPLMTRGSEPEIKQVLLNLVVNALEAVEPGRGRVTVEGGRCDGWVELRVTDNGRGMTPDVLEHVFEPFFSDKPGGPGSSGRRGLGLGLSISHAIVEGHGGRLRAESPGPGDVGSRFILQLPAERTAS